MQLLHPFMPFVTEEVYHQLRKRDEDDQLTISQFGHLAQNAILVSSIESNKILNMGNTLKESITAIRDQRNKIGLKPKETIDVSIETNDKEAFHVFENILQKQIVAETISYVEDNVDNSVTIVCGKNKFYLKAEKEIDVAAQKEQLVKEIDYLKGFLISVDKKLSNERFVNNAKPEVVDAERKKKLDAEQKIAALEESLSVLK